MRFACGRIHTSSRFTLISDACLESRLWAESVEPEAKLRTLPIIIKNIRGHNNERRVVSLLVSFAPEF